ncbi:MAG: Mov34/MPN/PAD-1 family protein [Endomicrobiia bacterium]|nr:Mov34/MPN/PAD-1 family protein [Endomicrobiia bacterium]
MPKQETTAGSVKYTGAATSGVVCEIHTHPGLGAFFSSIDDEDEKGFRIYGVIDSKQEYPEAVFRVGIYGHMSGLAPGQVFGPEADDIVDDVREEVLPFGAHSSIKDLELEGKR